MHIRVREFPSCLPGRVRTGETHVWWARLSDPPLPSAEIVNLLVPEERERGERYRHPAVREQFMIARGLLRALLGRYLDRAPEGVPIIIDANGKPCLPNRELAFNVSHSQGVALFVVGDRDVGIDLEAIRPVPTADGLVERYFSREENDQYFGLPVDLRTAAFLRGWTCKEAVLKGLGCGARGLERCVVDLDPRVSPRIIGLQGVNETWSLNCWEPIPGYVGAVAVNGSTEAELIVG